MSHRSVLVFASTLLLGCGALQRRVAESDDRNAWERAERRIVMLHNPAAVGKVITEGKQDVGTMIVGVRSYTPESLCFSVNADIQRVWPDVAGFEIMVPRALDDKDSAAIQSNSTQSPIGTHSLAGTQDTTTGGRTVVHDVEIPFEERAVCFANPTILTPSSTGLVLRMKYTKGSHAYFIWRLTNTSGAS